MQEESREQLTTLKERFPRLYRHCPGFECFGGWFELLRNLSGTLEKDAAEAGIPLDSEDYPYAIQVKTKFGGLRWYGGNLTEKMQEHIREASELSEKTCEMCGAAGVLRNSDGWIVGTCEKHAPEGSNPLEYGIRVVHSREKTA